MKAATRNKLPSEKFAGPGRSFPIHDPKHARLAIGGATRSEHAGNISAAQAESIKAQARAKLAKGKSQTERIASRVAARVSRRNDR